MIGHYGKIPDIENPTTPTPWQMIYFAYGSNLNLDRMRERCSSARFLFKARLNGYRLVFARYSTTDCSGSADIIYNPPAEVWGVVYHIHDDQRTELDVAEGVDLGSRKQFTLNAEREGERSQRVMALAYVVVDKGDLQLKPSAAYKTMMVDGAI